MAKASPKKSPSHASKVRLQKVLAEAGVEHIIAIAAEELVVVIASEQLIIIRVTTKRVSAIATVDLIVAVTVFQHIVADADWQLWMDELRRVLRPTGSALVIDEAHREDAVWDEHVRSRPPHEFARALNRGIVILPSLTDHWAGMLVP